MAVIPARCRLGTQTCRDDRRSTVIESGELGSQAGAQSWWMTVAMDHQRPAVGFGGQGAMRLDGAASGDRTANDPAGEEAPAQQRREDGVFAPQDGQGRERRARDTACGMGTWSRMSQAHAPNLETEGRPRRSADAVPLRPEYLEVPIGKRLLLGSNPAGSTASAASAGLAALVPFPGE